MKTGPQLYLKCEWCLEFFEYNGGKRRRWCGDAHKQAAHRAKQQDHSGPVSAAQAAANLQRNAKLLRAASFSIGPSMKR